MSAAATPAARPAAEWSLLLAVMVGGGVGSVCRAAVLGAVEGMSSSSSSLGSTLALSGINLLGGIVAGLVTTAWSGRALLRSRRFALVVPGWCGGFTTFSSFAAGASDRLADGEVAAAITTLAVGFLIGLLAARLGGALIRRG